MLVPNESPFVGVPVTVTSLHAQLYEPGPEQSTLQAIPLSPGPYPNYKLVPLIVVMKVPTSLSMRANPTPCTAEFVDSYIPAMEISHVLLSGPPLFVKLVLYCIYH